MNHFMYGFLDELEKQAESLRSLGLTDPKARKNFAKSLKMMPKAGPEGRHQAIKETRKGFKHWGKTERGRAMMAGVQKSLADSKF